MIASKILDGIFELVVQTGTELTFTKFVATEPGRKLLHKLNLTREIAANDFDSIYKLGCVDISS